MPTTLPHSLNRTLAILVAFAMALGAMVPMLAPAPARAATPTDLFFSEYIEGSSFNKALEIYNGTGAAVDLSVYTVELYSNGSATASQSVDLSGSLADGDVFVISRDDATSAITSVTDLFAPTVANFNGDDAVVLLKEGAAVDVIGQVGFDPGSEWGTGDATTVDHTLVRKPTISAGDPDGDDPFDPAIEWDGYPSNTFTFLGSHTFSSEPVQTDPSGSGSATPAAVAPGGTTTLSVSVIPGTNPTSTGLTVTADLGPIGGSSTQAFTAAGANVFTFEATVDPSVPPGGKVITATIADAEGRSATVAIELTVIEDVAGTVVISQVYGGGGNSGATIKNDFVELFNRTDAPISLDGWSVQYASASGTSWQVTELTGSIAAGGYYLVAEAAGSGGTVDLPAPDATGSIPMSASNGKVALSTSATALVGSCPIDGLADFVGFGTANCFEGTGATPGLGNTTAALRDEDGCQDTDDNAADFAMGAPAPRNSAAPANPCSGLPADAAPSVISTLPADGSVNVPTDQSIAVSFSEAVAVAEGWYNVTCSVSGTHSATVSGGPASYAIDPVVDFVAGDACTVTVFAASVTDADTIDPPDAMAADATFSFGVGSVCGNPTHFIHEVQGAGLGSPIDGATVTVEGVVIGDYQGSDPGLSGFFIQEEAVDADADPLTSEGIFVFDGFDPVQVGVGEVVSVTAEVDEFFGQTELTNVIDVSPCGTTAVVAPTEVELPVAAVDGLEAFEGMLVSFDQTLTVTETFSLGRFGEVVLSADGRQFQGTHVAEPGAPAAAVEDLNARSRIVLDDGDTSQNDDPTRYPTGGLSAENTLRVGATVDDLTAVLAFDHDLYRLQPIGEIAFEGGERPDGPPDVGGRIQVASFNVLNYFNGNGDGTGFDAPDQRGAENGFEFDRQRTKIINAISILDAEVVGLMEIENDGDAEYPAIADLVDGLNAKLGAGTYDYIDAGRVGTDAIAVAIIYQPSAVSPLGEFAVLDSSVDPRFDEDRNRAALAQTFVENETGAAFTVAVNHLKSKGSPCGAGDDQPDSLGGNCNVTRTLAAEALANWLASDPTGSGDADAVIIGDLNSYAMEDPITVLHDAGFTDLLAEFEGPSAYTYVFEGASGYLDHAQANAALTAQVSDAAPWHINADEPPVLDYNTNFKSPNHVQTLYAPDPFRSSDHDPVVIGLDLVLHEPTITSVEGPADPLEVGEEAALTATFTDVDGGETHTATIDWGDGSVTAGTVDQLTDSVAGSHAYASAGLYEVTVTVTDSGGLSGTEGIFPIVVYDPQAGFVTGGGRMDTPAGLASFEISIKYGKGADRPDGAFTFELPNASFEATSIDWLVVSGSTAWIQGEGALDGASGYRFLLAVNDRPDLMRVKIWAASDASDVVLDTQAGDPIDADPSNPITNGQINVHQNKGPAVMRGQRHR